MTSHRPFAYYLGGSSLWMAGMSLYGFLFTWLLVGVLEQPADKAGVARSIAELLAARPDGVTVSDVRTAWNTSRKYALPLLAHLDNTGVTRRRDDVRIGGPRLPA